jgi:hypothetical protein
LFRLVLSAIIVVFILALYVSSGVKGLAGFLCVLFGFVIVIAFIDFFDRQNSNAKEPVTSQETNLSRVLVFFPPYDPTMWAYPEYQRWKAYCVHVDCFIEYAIFSRLYIFPEYVEPNPLDEFLD